MSTLHLLQILSFSSRCSSNIPFNYPMCIDTKYKSQLLTLILFQQNKVAKTGGKTKSRISHIDDLSIRLLNAGLQKGTHLRRIVRFNLSVIEYHDIVVICQDTSLALMRFKALPVKITAFHSFFDGVISFILAVYFGLFALNF